MQKGEKGMRGKNTNYADLSSGGRKIYRYVFLEKGDKIWRPEFFTVIYLTNRIIGINWYLITICLEIESINKKAFHIHTHKIARPKVLFILKRKYISTVP